MKNILLFPTLLITAALTSCGSTDSNPLEKYNGIKGEAPTNEKAVVQTIITPDLFSAQVEGTNDVNVGQFVEGQSSSVLIKVKPKDLKISDYTVEMKDFSNLNRPVLQKTETCGIYSLTWLAPIGTINNDDHSKKFRVYLQITARTPNNRQLNGVANLRYIDVEVVKNTAQPKIGRSDLTKGVDEGQNQVFTVDVTDPNSEVNPRLPELIITPYLNSNTEAYRADGSRYLQLDDKKEINPEKISDTTFRFYYNLLVENLPLDRDRRGIEIPASSTVDMCFLMRAISGSGTSSDQLQVCTKARYAAQPPVISFSEISEVKAGQENIITFKVSAAHPLSVVAASKPSLLIANLSGKKEISCANETEDKKNSQTCVIKWTPACLSTTAVATLTVKADATMVDKTKSSTATKSLNVIPDLQTCPVPVTIKKGTK